MSQPKNKFLLCYGIVTALGAGVLGYLWYSASSDNETISENLAAKQGQVTKLESAPLFPNDSNLTKKIAQVDSFTTEVDNLHNALVGYQKVLNQEVLPDAVSANLGKYKTQLESIAKGRRIEFPMPPQGIDLGLSRYLGTSPKREAAPQLDYLVESVNSLLTELIRAGVSKIDFINCPERPYEKEATAFIEKKVLPKKAPKQAPPKTAKSDPKAAVKKEEAPLLEENSVFNRYSVQLAFTSSEKAAQEFLNQISTVGEGGPFWVINSMRVDNEKKVGDPVASGFVATPITPPVGTTPEKDAKVNMIDVKYVLGNEKVTVTLDLDLVRFISITREESTK